MIKYFLLIFFVCAKVWAVGLFGGCFGAPNKQKNKRDKYIFPYVIMQIIFDYHVSDIEPQAGALILPRCVRELPIKRLSFCVSDIEISSKKPMEEMAQLKHLSALEIDVFCESGWGGGAGSYIAQLLSKVALRELRLDLNFNLLFIQDIKALAGAIGLQKNLRHLILSFDKCGLLGDEAEEIVRAASSLTSLMQLRLNFKNNDIGDKHVDAIIAQLLTKKDLVALELHLGENPISPAVQRSIETKLETLPKLRELHVNELNTDIWLARNARWEIQPNVELEEVAE